MKPGSRSRFQRFVSLAVAAGLALTPGPALAQTFTDTTEVVVVEIPVQVIKDGEPVRGLTAESFEVFEGRKKVPITGFEVLDLGAAPSGPAAQEVPVSARRHFMMLFDLSFSEPKSIVKARAAAQDIVNQLHPTDLVSVATYNTQQGPQLIIGFTPDRRQIAAAIETLGVPKLFDRSPDPLRLVLTSTRQEMDNRPAEGGVGPRNAGVREGNEAAILENLEALAKGTERADRTAREQQLRAMTQSFSELARLMGEVEGRKHVVLLSEGFDNTLIAGRAGMDDGNRTEQVNAIGNDDRFLPTAPDASTDSEYGNTRSLNLVERMITEFKRADCAIQAVDIGGLRAEADQGFQRKHGKDALFNLAKSTGGELYENTNDIKGAMGQMLRRNGVTYVLSFQPDKLKNDGSFHSLKVELKGDAVRGARVVHRPGFYAPRPLKEQPAMQRLLETASAVMDEDSGSISTSVLAAPFASSGNLADVPVVVQIDGPSLLAGKQAPQLPLEIYIYAMDANGGVQDFVTQTVGLDLSKTEPVLRQAGLKFFGNLRLPPGDYSLRVLVRNGSTGGSAVRVAEVKVPAFGQGETALLPAIFEDAAPGRWVNLRQTKKEGEPEPPYLFMDKDRPYVPMARPTLVPGQDAALFLHGFNLPAGDFKADAKIVGADGKELPGTLQLVKQEAGSGARPTRMVATFRPPNLPPGEYQLRITLTDGAGKASTSQSLFAVGAPAAGARSGK